MAKQPTNGEPSRQVGDLEKGVLKHPETQADIRVFRTAAEQSIDGIAMSNLERRYTYVNKAYAEMHGYSPEEMIGMEVTRVHKDQLGDQQGLVKKQIDTQGSWSGDIEHIRRDGTPFPTNSTFSLLRDDGENPTAVVCVCRDITFRTKAMRELKESEERYRTLFENANDAIFIGDPETGMILDANRQAERLMDRPRQEIIGMHQSALHPADQIEYYKDKFRDHAQKGSVFDLEAEVIRKDGSIVPVSISASVILIMGKEMLQAMFRDLTEEKRLLELREKLADTKLIEKAKGILMTRYNFTEQQAITRLQKESRKQRKKTRYIAEVVISSESVLDQL